MQTETHAAAIARARKLIDAEERHRAFSTQTGQRFTQALA
jgi:hypothetical protein